MTRRKKNPPHRKLSSFTLFHYCLTCQVWQNKSIITDHFYRYVLAIKFDHYNVQYSMFDPEVAIFLCTSYTSSVSSCSVFPSSAFRFLEFLPPWLSPAFCRYILMHWWTSSCVVLSIFFILMTASTWRRDKKEEKKKKKEMIKNMHINKYTWMQLNFKRRPNTWTLQSRCKA